MEPPKPKSDVLSLLAYLENREKFKEAEDLATTQPIAEAVQRVLDAFATTVPGSSTVETLLAALDRMGGKAEKQEAIRNFSADMRDQIERRAQAAFVWPDTSQPLLANQEEVAKAKRKYDLASAPTSKDTQEALVAMRAFVDQMSQSVKGHLTKADQIRLDAVNAALSKVSV